MQAKARWQGNLMCSISSAHRDVIVNFLCVCCFIGIHEVFDLHFDIFDAEQFGLNSHA